MKISELRSMREAGFTYREIESMTGVPWGTVRSRCRSLGISPQVAVIRRRRRPIKRDLSMWLLNEMYWVCGLSVVDIGFELDCPQTSVVAAMRRHGIPRRTRSEANRRARVRYPIRPPGANREQALRASEASAKARRRRARSNRRRRDQRKALA